MYNRRLKMEKIIYTTYEQDVVNFSSKTKQELFEIYSYLTNFFSKKMYTQYSYNKVLEKDDLKQLANIALWKTIEKYDIYKSVKFSTFAFIKMPNIIKDEIRCLTHSRNQNAMCSNTMASLDVKDYVIKDERVFVSKEEQLIENIIKVLEQSDLPSKSIKVFIDAVLYNLPQKHLSNKYNITGSMISHYCKRVKNYLKDNREKIDI